MISDVLERKIFDGPDCYHWRNVFVWWPVKTISGKYVWMNWIYKQKFYKATPWYGQNYKMVLQVEYGELFDILKEKQNELY